MHKQIFVNIIQNFNVVVQFNQIVHPKPFILLKQKKLINFVVVPFGFFVCSGGIFKCFFNKLRFACIISNNLRYAIQILVPEISTDFSVFF